MKALLATVFAALLPVSAQAVTCAPRPAVIERMAAEYGEVLHGAGLSQNGAVIEVYASPETGTWTIVVTTPTGLTCVVAVGEAWSRIKLVPVGDPT